MSNVIHVGKRWEVRDNGDTKEVWRNFPDLGWRLEERKPTEQDCMQYIVDAIVREKASPVPVAPSPTTDGRNHIRYRPRRVLPRRRLRRIEVGDVVPDYQAYKFQIREIIDSEQIRLQGEVASLKERHDLDVKTIEFLTLRADRLRYGIQRILAAFEYQGASGLVGVLYEAHENLKKIIEDDS